jgi:hypothetical protein
MANSNNKMHFGGANITVPGMNCKCIVGYTVVNSKKHAFAKATMATDSRAACFSVRTGGGTSDLSCQSALSSSFAVAREATDRDENRHDSLWRQPRGTLGS